MLNHEERVTAARAAVDYITGRTTEEQSRPVPNCPGWSVYNAASHIGRVSIAWEAMITATPDDPESRTRGYAKSDQQPPGTPVDQLAAWCHSALDHLGGDLDRPCYFSMTGGHGTVGLWGWHAASELGIHRLDVEAALGHEHAMTNAQAGDAVTYTCQYFFPAMRRATEEDPGGLKISLTGSDDSVVDLAVESEAGRSATVSGPPTQVLLALWGRPHRDVFVSDGDPQVLADWQALPGKAFQFGTWD